MEDDTIKRSDAIEAIINKPAWHGSDGSYYHSDDIRDALESLPSAHRPSDPHNITYINALKNRIRELEAKRPQGEWIDKGDHAECSNCGADSGTQFDGVEPVPRKTKFCPHCGAMMKGADDE